MPTYVVMYRFTEQGRRSIGRKAEHRTDVFDLSYEFWGDTAGADETVTRGDIAAGSFSTW